MNEGTEDEIKILLVDDEPDLLEQGEIFLEREDDRFQIDTSTKVEEAMEMLEENDYDAVASDYKMPDKDGIDLLEWLRENENDIPFIILTGRGDEEVAMKALNLGADRYFTKSEDPETLFSLLSNALVKEVREKRTRERNRFLNSLLSHDLKKRAETSNKHLKKLSKSDLTPEAEELVERAKESLMEGIELIEETQSEKRRESESKVSNVIIRSLDKFLGYAYWSEFQMSSSNIMNLYQKIGKYKDSLLELAQRSTEHQSLLEAIGTNLEGINFKEDVEPADMKELYTGSKTEEQIFDDLKEREEFKLDVYKKLQTSTDIEVIRDIWKGDDPGEYFEILDDLIKGKEENIDLLNRIKKQKFLGL